MHFQLFKDTAGEWRWNLRSANGEIIAASEGYTTKRSAVRSASRLVAQMLRLEDIPIVERLK